MLSRIPNAQVAYEQGRSTTELIFSMKTTCFFTAIRYAKRMFESCVEILFTYNCELWTLAKRHEENSFQRKFFRRIFHMNWHDRVSNGKLCKETDQTPWSQIVELGRLTWYGHLLEQPEINRQKRH